MTKPTKVDHPLVYRLMDSALGFEGEGGVYDDDEAWEDIPAERLRAAEAELLAFFAGAAPGLPEAMMDLLGAQALEGYALSCTDDSGQAVELDCFRIIDEVL